MKDSKYMLQALQYPVSRSSFTQAFVIVFAAVMQASSWQARPLDVSFDRSISRFNALEIKTCNACKPLCCFAKYMTL
jgi:hypothetical protein